MEDKDALPRSLAALSHELRTPLNAILGFSQVLIGEIDGPINDAQREDLKIIHASGERLRSLFDDMLDYYARSAVELSTSLPEPPAERKINRTRTLVEMGHELKNPLNSITGFADILASGAEGELNVEQSKNVGIIRQSAEHLLRLTSAVVDDARIDAGVLPLHKRWLSVEELTQDVLALVRTRAGDRGVYSQVHPTLPSVFVDRDRTARALAAFMEVVLRVTEHDIVLRARAHRFSPSGAEVVEFAIIGNAELTSEDTSELLHLFEEEHPDAGGLGLELSVARRTIEVQQGRVWTEAGTAGGLRVCATLPTRDLSAPVSIVRGA